MIYEGKGGCTDGKHWSEGLQIFLPKDSNPSLEGMREIETHAPAEPDTPLYVHNIPQGADSGVTPTGYRNALYEKRTSEWREPPQASANKIS